jgi:SAM-dependent methyltransferase
MLFLSRQEKREWAAYADQVLRDSPAPGSYDTRVRRNLVPAFHFFIGAILAAKGRGEESRKWLEAGSLVEDDGLSCCTFLLGFLKRYHDRMVSPTIVFQDPRPFVHFTRVPVMKGARRQFIRHAGHSLPAFDEPIRFLDLGCGDGGLTRDMLSHLYSTGKVPGFSEVLLVDPSPAMAGLAQETVGSAFPDVTAAVENCRIQDFSARIDERFDIVMSSFAYHHMPIEEKRIDLSRLKPWIDHFLLFEIDANNDIPELFSPDLALSVYQSYGRIIAFALAIDAPPDVVTDSIDSFLMTEIISMLTEPRGVRTDYHMLRSQWNALFADELGPGFSLRCDSTCYADEYMTMFALHYGRDQKA